MKYKIALIAVVLMVSFSMCFGQNNLCTAIVVPPSQFTYYSTHWIYTYPIIHDTVHTGDTIIIKCFFIPNGDVPCSFVNINCVTEHPTAPPTYFEWFYWDTAHQVWQGIVAGYDVGKNIIKYDSCLVIYPATSINNRMRYRLDFSMCENQGAGFQSTTYSSSEVTVFVLPPSTAIQTKPTISNHPIAMKGNRVFNVAGKEIYSSPKHGVYFTPKGMVVKY